MTGLIVDLFGGCGGWAEGLRSLGLAEVGIEIDPWACATRAAVGHPTIRADVERLPLEPFEERGVTGLLASPPCPMFSNAGGGAGRALLEELGVMIRLAFAGHSTTWFRRNMARKLRAERLCTTKATRAEASRIAWHSATEAALTAAPARWIHATRPEWIAFEQVPPVLPLWEFYGELLRGAGYSVWTGVLCAADFGVPQTRRRAILMASRVWPVTAPAPTHGADSHPSLFGARLPWVSMAEALGWGVGTPSRALAGVGGTHGHVMELDRRTNSRYGRGVTAPTATVPMDRPAPTVTAQAGAGGQWIFKRPATTVCGDPRIGRPGHKDRAGGESQFAEDSIRLSLADALVLQGFDPTYPVQGNKTEQFRQVGNAIPPPLAAHIVAAAAGIDALAAAG